MLGSDLLDEYAKDLSEQQDGRKVSDSQLANHLGMSLPSLKKLRGKELSAGQIVDIMRRRGRTVEREICDRSILPIVEFFELEYEWTARGASARLFPLKDENGKPFPYLVQLCDRLKMARGIYVFHDSRGRAIYAGKAVLQPLWTEMNNAYNRNRGDVQSIKRADHPRIRGVFGATDVQITKREICLWEMASYVSAYEVHGELISKMEALIIRSFANDLLNVRMEHF